MYVYIYVYIYVYTKREKKTRKGAQERHAATAQRYPETIHGGRECAIPFLKMYAEGNKDERKRPALECPRKLMVGEGVPMAGLART